MLNNEYGSTERVHCSPDNYRIIIDNRKGFSQPGDPADEKSRKVPRRHARSMSEENPPFYN